MQIKMTVDSEQQENNCDEMVIGNIKFPLSHSALAIWPQLPPQRIL